MPNWEPAADRGLWALCDPRMSNPSKDEEEVLLWSEEFWVKITVLTCLHSPLTHKKHHPFENKLWEIYFIKKCIRSFIEVRHYVWLCFCIYMYMYMYVEHTNLHGLFKAKVILIEEHLWFYSTFTPGWEDNEVHSDKNRWEGQQLLHIDIRILNVYWNVKSARWFHFLHR